MGTQDLGTGTRTIMTQVAAETLGLQMGQIKLVIGDNSLPPGGSSGGSTTVGVGWTVPGEWFNLTVQVAEAGEYSADLLYTSNRGGSISLDVNGEAATGPLTIARTYDTADPVAWRQWHHWNLAPGIARLKLPKGKSVLTVRIVTEGQMNLAN